MRDRSSNSGTASPNPKYKTTVAIQPRSNRSADLRKQHQSQRSPVSPFNHTLAHMDLDEDEVDNPNYHGGYTNDYGGSLSRSASLGRLRSRSANNSRSPSRFSSVLSLPSPGNSIKYPKGTKFPYSPKGGSTLSRSESALNARFPQPDDANTDWLDGRLTNVPCIDMGRALPPVKTKYKHPFYEKRKKRPRSGNNNGQETRSTVSDVTDSNDNQENPQSDRDSRNKHHHHHHHHPHADCNDSHERDMKKKKTQQRPMVLEDDPNSSPRNGRDVPKFLDLDTYNKPRKSRSPEKESKRFSPKKNAPTSAKQNYNEKPDSQNNTHADSQASTPGENDEYSRPIENNGPRYVNNQKNSPQKPSCDDGRNSPLSLDDGNTSEDEDISRSQNSPNKEISSPNKGLARHSPEKYQNNIKTEPWKYDDDNSRNNYRNNESPYKTPAKTNNFSPYSKNSKDRNSDNYGEPRFEEVPKDRDYQLNRKPVKNYSPQGSPERGYRNPKNLNEKLEEPVNNRRFHASEDDPDGYYVSEDGPKRTNPDESSFRQDNGYRKDPYRREEKSSIDEPMILATKRGHVKFQSPGNSNSSPEADDDQKRTPKNSSRDKDSDELPSTLFKPTSKVDNHGRHPENLHTAEHPNKEIARYQGTEQPGEQPSSVEGKDPQSKSGKNPGVPVIRSEMNVYLNYLDVADGAENLSDTDTDIIIEKTDDSENSESEPEDFRFMKDSKPQKDHPGRVDSRKPAIDNSMSREEANARHGSTSPHKRGFVKIDVKNNEKKQEIVNKVPDDTKDAAQNKKQSEPNPNQKYAQRISPPRKQTETPTGRYTSSYSTRLNQKPSANQSKPTKPTNENTKRNESNPMKDPDVLSDRTDFHDPPFVSEKILIPDSEQNLKTGNRKPDTEQGRNRQANNKHSVLPERNRKPEEQKTKSSRNQPNQSSKEAPSNNKKPKAFSDNLFDRKTGKFVPDPVFDPNKLDYDDHFDQSLNVQTDLSHIFDSDEDELGSRIEKEVPPSKVDFDLIRNMFNTRKIYKDAEDFTDSYQKRKQMKDFGRISQGLVEKLRQYFDSKEMKARRELQFYRLIHDDLANKHNSMKQWDPLMLSPFDEKFVSQQQYRYWVLDARTKRTCERSMSMGRSPIDLEYLERNRYKYQVRESKNATGYSSLGGSLANTPSSSAIDLHKPRGRSESRASSRNSTRKTPRGVKNMSHRRQNSDPLIASADPVDFDEHLLNECNNLPPAVEDRDYKEQPDVYNNGDQPDDFVNEDEIIKETRGSKRTQEKPTSKVSTYNMKPSSTKPENDKIKRNHNDPKKQDVGKYDIPYKPKSESNRNPVTYEGPSEENFAPNKAPSDRSHKNETGKKPQQQVNHKRNVSEHSPGTPGTDLSTPGQLYLDPMYNPSPIFSDSSESPQDETSRLVSFYTPQQYNPSDSKAQPGTRAKNPDGKAYPDNNNKSRNPPSGDKKPQKEAPVGTRTVIHDPFNEDHSTYLKHEQERTFAYHPKSGKTFQLDSPRSMASVSSKDDPAYLIKTVRRTTEERSTHIESCGNVNEIEIDDSIRELADRLVNFQYNDNVDNQDEPSRGNKSSKASGRKYVPKEKKNMEMFKSYDNLRSSAFDEVSLRVTHERSKSMDELNWSKREKRIEYEKAEHSQNEDENGGPSLHQHNSSSMENLIDKGYKPKVSKYNSHLLNASNQSLNARTPSVLSSNTVNKSPGGGRERLIKKGKTGDPSNPWSPSHNNRSPYSSTHSLNSVGNYSNSMSQNSNTYYTTNFGGGAGRPQHQETHFQAKDSAPSNPNKPPKQKARVLFDFIPYTKRELGAKMGEIIDIEEQVDENWVQASLRDQIGLIPLTYIEFLKPNQAPIVGKAFFGSMESGMGRDERDTQKPLHGSNQNLSQGRKSALVRPFQSQEEALQRYDEPPTSKNTQNHVLHSEPQSHAKQHANMQSIENMHNMHGSPLTKHASKIAPQNKQLQQHHHQQQPVNNQTKSPLGISNTRLGRVKYNFESQTEIELNLRAGEIVNIRKQVDDNWFDGYIGNRRGIFPIDYVEILSKDVQNGIPQNGKNFGTKNGPEKPLKHLAASQPAFANNNSVNNSYQNSPYHHKHNRAEDEHSKKPQEYCRVLFNFQPKQSDELELVENDVILVVKKCSDGWFIGSSTRTGQFGSFPGNYVEQLIYQ